MSLMGRRKTVWLDAPPRMTRRSRKKGGFNYYYQAGGKKIPLGTNLIAAKAEWARLEGGNHVKLFPQVTEEYRKLFPGLRPSTQKHYENALQNLELAFRKFTLEQI